MEIVPDCERAADAGATSANAETAMTVSPEARRRKLVPVVFVGAFLVAPLLASFVRLEAGLVVMGIALLATAGVLHGAIGELPAQHLRVLRALLAINIVFAIACFAAAIVRLATG